MKKISTITLTGTGGLEVAISTYGAKILRLLVPDRAGEKVDVVLGFSSMEEWQAQEPSFNAVIGRYANRIKDGRFTIDGHRYQLPINCEGNTLHGGLEGFQQQIWDIVGQSAYSVSLHYRSMDGEQGFPGTVDVYVTYQITKDNALRITYEAKTTAPTVINLTQHAYFNLEGEQAESIRDHILQIHADAFTEMDDSNCPTGKILSVEGTAMDFRQPTRIGDRIDHDFFARTRGIDANWVVSRDSLEKRLSLVATLSGAGRTMQVFTTEPGLQVYTANFVENNRGKTGTMYHPQNAICLETQNYPDAPNHPSFPSAILRPGEIYFSQTEYKFLSL